MSSLPSCLTMVNRVLEECGDLTVNSLNPGTRNSKIALEALNDAVFDIWERQRWPWQRNTYTFTLVADQGDYPLPDRFDRLAEPIRLGSAGSFWPLLEYTDEQWVNQQLEAPPTSGTPRYFKISNTTLSLSPAPASDFLTTYPTLLFSYFQEVPPRRGVTDDNNSFDVPYHFYPEMVSYGKSKLKQYLAMPDWQVDSEDYEKGMRIHFNKVREGRRPAVVRPQNWIVSTW